MSTKLPIPKQDELTVKVFSSRETYYDGSARYVSAANGTGTFDILPLHHSFISLLLPGELKIGLKDGRDKAISIQKGLLRVRNNEVVVFLDV